MENEMTIEELEEELLELEVLGWSEDYNTFHAFNDKKEKKRLERIEWLQEQIKQMEMRNDR